MTSLKQITANRLNALKSTGPRSADGKQRSRQNALRHGLTAETWMITALEHAADYQALEESIMADHQPRSATERELVLRLASVLWRLRRRPPSRPACFNSGRIDPKQYAAAARRRTVPPPQWYDEHDTAPTIDGTAIPLCDPDEAANPPPDPSETLADCFLQVSRLGYGAFDLLNRYEAALRRQAAQLLFIL